jgi:hypothetical protein
MSLPPQLKTDRGKKFSAAALFLGMFLAFVLVTVATTNDGARPAEAVGGITGTFIGSPVSGSGTWNNFQGGPCLDPSGEPRWYIGINWDAGTETNDTLIANQEYLAPLDCTGTQDPATRNWGPIDCTQSDQGDVCSTVNEPCVTLYHAAQNNTQGNDVAATTCELIAPTATPTATATNTATATATATATSTATATPTFTPSPTATPAKCNSGRGNASETLPGNDCDPGNSGGKNQGGD